MQIHRFFVDGVTPLSSGATATLSAADSHHLSAVLRLTPGSAVVLCERSSGRSYHGVVATADHAATTVLVGNALPPPQGSPRAGALIFGLCKGDKNDLVCEKATELGASQIILWQTTHSIVKIPAADRAKKLERFSKIIEAAGKQSGNTRLPQLAICHTAEEVLTALVRTPEDLCGICSLIPGAVELHTLPAPAGRVHLAVGPEGSFTPQEEESLVRAGFLRITLGSTTLRSETAAIAALASAQGAFGMIPRNR